MTRSSPAVDAPARTHRSVQRRDELGAIPSWPGYGLGMWQERRGSITLSAMVGAGALSLGVALSAPFMGGLADRLGRLMPAQSQSAQTLMGLPHHRGVGFPFLHGLVVQTHGGRRIGTNTARDHGNINAFRLQTVDELGDVHELLEKSIHPEPPVVLSEGGMIRLQPSNKEMAPIFAPAANVAIQGKVLGILRKYA